VPNPESVEKLLFPENLDIFETLDLSLIWSKSLFTFFLED
jgi:hypothetical protein